MLDSEGEEEDSEEEEDMLKNEFKVQKKRWGSYPILLFPLE